MIWFTSDLHLNHYNILTLEKENLAKNGLSYIRTIEEYNDMIINRINSCVKAEDTLYILGDVAFGGLDVIRPLINRINGHKILVMGNHDRFQKSQGQYLGFKETYDCPIYLNGVRGKVILSHEPVMEAYNNPYVTLNIHGHLHNSCLDLPNYLNINIAEHEYYPVNYDTLCKRIFNSGKNRRESFGQEWYIKHQKFSKSESGRLNLDINGHLIL